MAKYTSEQKAAKQKLANDKARVRALLIAGKAPEAIAYAIKCGFNVFDARLGPEYKNPAEPFFVALEKGIETWQAPTATKDVPLVTFEPLPKTEVPAEEPPVKEPASINGWPVYSRAIVWAMCPNKLMVVIQLPDGRTASMWKSRRTWRIYDKTNIHLVESAADPIYEPLQPEPRYMPFSELPK